MSEQNYQKQLSDKWQVRTTQSHDQTLMLRYGVHLNGNPSLESLKRFVVFFNGRTEWIEKNMELPEWLNLPPDCGYLTWDHRGQGASEGERAYVASYDDYARDAAKIIDEVVGSRSKVVMCHSMGGLVALTTILKNFTSAPKALVLSAPLLKLHSFPIPGVVAQGLSIAASSLGFAKRRSGAGTNDKRAFPRNKLTHDPDAYQVVCHSPYRVPSATFGWIKATFEAINFVFDPANLQNYSIPTLLINPSEESVVDPKGPQEWATLVSSFAKEPIKLMTIHGARHELFSELPQFRDRAVKATRDWFGDFL